MARSISLKTFVSGTMTTCDDIFVNTTSSKHNELNISSLNELSNFVIKRHQTLFFLPKLDIVTVLNLRSYRIVDTIIRLEHQLESNDSLWFVTQEEWKEFVSECHLDLDSIESELFQPSSLSMRQLQCFINNYCDHHSFHLGSPINGKSCVSYPPHEKVVYFSSRRLITYHIILNPTFFRQIVIPFAA